MFDEVYKQYKKLKCQLINKYQTINQKINSTVCIGNYFTVKPFVLISSVMNKSIVVKISSPTNHLIIHLVWHNKNKIVKFLCGSFRNMTEYRPKVIKKTLL